MKFLSLLGIAILFVCLAKISPCTAQGDAADISDWGNQTVELLTTIEKFSEDPSHADEADGELVGGALGAAGGGAAGAGLANQLCDGCGGFGALLGAAAGGLVGAKLGEETGADWDNVRNFYIQDSQLLTQIDRQLTTLSALAQPGSDNAVEISNADNEARGEYAQANNAVTDLLDHNFVTFSSAKRQMPDYQSDADDLWQRTNKLSLDLQGQ